MNQTYSPKDPGEVIALEWDFAPIIAPSVTIVSAAWEVLNPEDATQDLSSMLVGGPSISGMFVRQRFMLGPDGVSIKHRITAVGSDGLVYIEKPTQLVTSE